MPKSKGDPRRAKALAYVREGRVLIVQAATPSGDRRPYAVRALIRGHLATYDVHGVSGVWICHCRGEDAPMSNPPTQCAHAAAAALVTGWPSAAGPPAQTPAANTAGAQHDPS